MKPEKTVKSNQESPFPETPGICVSEDRDLNWKAEMLY